MDTYLTASLAADHRRTLVAEAVSYRQIRAARRDVRRGRPGAQLAASRGRSVRHPFGAFTPRHVTG